MPVRHALNSRLLFHDIFLLCVDYGAAKQLELGVTQWRLCHETLNGILDTHEFGVPVPAAFSTKIQRCLAPNVPPKPIVEVGIHDATAFLHKLAEDAATVGEVLECSGLSSLVVGHSV